MTPSCDSKSQSPGSGSGTNRTPGGVVPDRAVFVESAVSVVGGRSTGSGYLPQLSSGNR